MSQTGARESSSRASGRYVRVAIVSDTHGFLDPRIAELVASCDVAVHAGDIGGVGVLRELRPRLGRVLAVRGNNDTAEKWAPGEGRVLSRLTDEVVLDLPGGRLVVVHGDKAGTGQKRHDRLRKSYPDARAVVYGHSHHTLCDRRQKPWLLNPGAAGRSRTFGGPSCLLLVASEKRWQVSQIKFEPLHPSSPGRFLPRR
jgi:putative phosphoesterase